MALKGIGGLGSFRGEYYNIDRATASALVGIGGSDADVDESTSRNMTWTVQDTKQNEGWSNNDNLSGGTLVQKGQKISLLKALAESGEVAEKLSKVKIGIGWKLNNPDSEEMDIDVFTFALNNEGRTRFDEDFVFYGNPDPTGIGISYVAGEYERNAREDYVSVDLKNIPGEIMKIAFAVTIYDGMNRKQNFKMVADGFLRIIDFENNREILKFELPDNYNDETAIVLGELYRYKNDWKFNPIGLGFNKGLDALCKNYGISVE